MDPDRIEKVVRWQRKIEKARNSLIDMIEFMMPDQEDPDDAGRSSYSAQTFHRYIAGNMERMIFTMENRLHRLGKLKLSRGCVTPKEMDDPSNHLRRLAISAPPQFGKALALDTPVLTTAGWTTMAALQVGDCVFAPDGRPTRVIAKSEVFIDREVYRVTTDDGDEIIADGEHEWRVRLCRKHNAITTRTTKFLAERKSKRLPMIAAAAPVELPTADLPIDPYVLGAWLGNGDTGSSIITTPDYELADEVEAVEGEGRRTEFKHGSFRFRAGPSLREGAVKHAETLQGRLRLLGVLNNKHIPEQYLLASKEQRLSLLQGLIDTDGYVAPNGQIEFCSTIDRIAHGVQRLVWSLGVKCSILYGRAMLYGKDCGPKYRVFFHLKDAARVSRKAGHCRTGIKSTRRYIRVEKFGTADTVCIQVDHPTNMFLCGRSLLPTHNSLIWMMANAWAFGRNPRMNGIYATYNNEFAEDRGAFCRSILSDPRFRAVFPDLMLAPLEKSKAIMVSTVRGQLLFIGRGQGGTGRPADLYLIDDPYKTKEEAESEIVSRMIWHWLTTAAVTRMRSSSVMGIIHTRWVDGDLIGVMGDQNSDAYDPAIARHWTYINIPSIFEYIPSAGIDDRDIAAACGKQIGDTLWPEEFSLEDLLQRRDMDERGFNALMQGRPTSDSGDFFPSECFREYNDEKEIPPGMVYYGASDHSIGARQEADRSCIGVIGVDCQMNIWVMPDLVWGRIETDKQVDELIRLAKKYNCQSWFPEDENIRKAIGPFLRKRMMEERCQTSIIPQRPSKDKVAMATSLQGMIKMRRVFFPSFAWWWNPSQKRMSNKKIVPSARREMVKFPRAPHDDFVSFMSLACFGLDWMWKAVKPAEKSKTYKPGSFGAMLHMMQETEDELERDLILRSG